MNTAIKTLLILFLATFSLHSYSNVSPGLRKNVNVSNQNPNRIICLNGNINEIFVPSHIPHDLKIVRDHVFLTYKMKRKGAKIEYVTIPHDINIVCDGEVYTLAANPKKTNGGSAINLGDPNLSLLMANAKKIQDHSIEDIFVEMFLDAFNENLPPNYTVKEQTGFIKVNNNINVNMRRTISLNGIGVRLKEYTVHTNSTLTVDKKLFLTRHFSKKMRGIVLIPETIKPNKPARLFIIEDK